MLAAPEDDPEYVPQAVATHAMQDMPTSTQGDRWLEFARQMLTTPESNHMAAQADFVQLPAGDAWLQDMFETDSVWPDSDIMT